MPRQEIMTGTIRQSRGHLADVRVVTEGESVRLARDSSPLFKLQVPSHWLSPVSRNPHAIEAEKSVLNWFRFLGCSAAELQRAGKFDAAGYVGIPFPGLSREMTIRIGKYLSIWLLWDDVHIESLEDRWRIKASHIKANQKPENMTRFDEGWWALFQEYARRRSPEWVGVLCQAMIDWNDAAGREALLIKARRECGTLPAFAEQLEIRIATIGMYATVYLLEDEYDFELPQSFHQHPTVKLIKKLSNEIVGLGNDIFSLGKDIGEGQLNLVTTLMHERSLSFSEALTHIIQMHNDALASYDRLAHSVSKGWGAETDRYVERWLQDVRYASLGFSLWEAQAPRYTSHKVVAGGRVIEPTFNIFKSGAAERWQPEHISENYELGMQTRLLHRAHAG